MNVDKTKSDIKQRHKENTVHLESNYPTLYKHIVKSNKEISLTVDEITLNLNKTVNGNIIYPEGASEFAKSEVSAFIDKMNSLNYKPSPLTINIKDIIKRNSFINTAKHYSRYYDKCTQKTPKNSNLIVYGVGLGYHIKLLNDSKLFNKITIIENSISNFKESLYCIDWKKLLNKDSNISLILNFNENTIEFESEIDDFLNQNFPSIIISTLIYNHLEYSNNTDKYNKVKERISDYCRFKQVAFERAGPESQRLLNSNSNIQLSNKILNLDKTNIGNENTNILIVGSGPSLDNYIEGIRRFRDSFFIISSGSSLVSLLKSNITPDIHFELEFQNLAALNLDHVSKSFNLKEIPLVCSLSSNPKLSGFFKETHYFIQETSELSSHLPKESVLHLGGITCTNGAAAFASRVSNASIFFAGLDFAYTNKMHHAKDNISQQNDLSGDLKNLEAKKNYNTLADIETLDVFGNTVMTTTVLNSARILIQNLIKNSDNTFYNCSYGAKIENTENLTPDALLSKLEKKPNSEAVIIYSYNLTNNYDINKVIKCVFQRSFKACDEISNIIRININQDNDFSNLVKLIFESITLDFSNDQAQLRNVMSFNTLPLLSLFVIANYTDDSYRLDIIKTWLNDYISYIDSVKETIISHITKNEYPSTEDWIESNK